MRRRRPRRAKRYEGRRPPNGWGFRWRADRGPVLIGTIPWVVTDAGRVGGRRLGETAEQALRRLMEPNTQKEASHE